MSKNIILVLMYHRHKLLDLIITIITIIIIIIIIIIITSFVCLYTVPH
jgi:hypothetical protein